MSNTEKLNLNVEITFNDDGTLDMQSFAQSPLIDKLTVDSRGLIHIPNDAQLSDMQREVVKTAVRFNINITRFIELCLDAELQEEKPEEPSSVVVVFPETGTKH